MEIDPEKFKALAAEIFQKFRELETEMQALRFAIYLTKVDGLTDPAIPWEATIEAAKQNPFLVKMMADKYDPLVADVLASIDQASLGQVLSEWFRKWKPSGPIN